MSSSYYTHGTGPDEQQRLTAMNRLLNERFVAQAALVPGERIIDFVAGLGQLSRAMARVTGVPVVGIERSREQIIEARRQAGLAVGGRDPDVEGGALRHPSTLPRIGKASIKNGWLQTRPDEVLRPRGNECG